MKPGGGAETFEIIRFAAGVDRCVRAAVERALEADDVDAVRMAVCRMIFARRLQRAFDRFGAGVGEEHNVGEVSRVYFAASSSWPFT